MSKPASVEQYKLVTSFESIRQTLLNGKSADRLEKPLAYWALPNDRRLPLALLEVRVSDLLARPYDELSSTPGIGQKKMGALVKLLLRAANDPDHVVPFGIAELAPGDDSDESAVLTANGFDSSKVSESQWTRWTQAIRQHGLHSEAIGKFAISLQHLPTVIWDRPLSFYLGYTLAEIRKLKTHGEKRVGVILEVYHDIHRVLQSLPRNGPIAARLTPRFAQQIESSVADALAAEEPPQAEAMRKEIANVLLKQIKIDLGDAIHQLCAGRIGLRGKPQSVMAQSRKLGVTRARVYQLLDECAKAFQVRWPLGRFQLAALAQLYAHDEGNEALRMLSAARQICFPDKLDGEQLEAVQLEAND